MTNRGPTFIAAYPGECVECGGCVEGEPVRFVDSEITHVDCDDTEDDDLDDMIESE